MEFTELALGGDPLLGGSDFDRLIRDDVIKTYREEAADEYGELSKRDIDKLLKKCEDAKIDLKVLMNTEITVNDDIDWTYNLSRSHMNSLIGGKIDESIRLCDEAIARAGLTVDDIDEIVLVGGSTRLCIVEEKLKKHFPQLEIKQTVNPDECVAVGAAKYAYAISTGKIKRNGINVTPICPSNIGIQGSEGEMIVLISAGDELPCKKTQTVSNTEDYVRRIPIRVYQGNDPMCANNTKLKQVNLTINHPGIAGENVFEISCSLDQMGNLTLGVKEANKNGPEKKIRNFQATWTAEEIKSLQQQLTHDTAELEAYNQIQERANSLINRTSAVMTHMPDDKRKSVESLMREWSIHPDTSVLDRLEELLRESRVCSHSPFSTCRNKQGTSHAHIHSTIWKQPR